MLLKTAAEVQQVESAVINGVDNPNLLSVDSTTPITTTVDTPVSADGEETSETPSGDKPVEKKPVETPAVVEKKEDKSTFQKRIDDLTKARRTAEREAVIVKEQSEKKIKELEEEVKKLKAQAPIANKPKRESFETDEEYLEAVSSFTVAQKLKETQEAADKATATLQEQQAVDDVFKGLDEVMEKGRVKYSDFNELVLSDELTLTPAMTEVILQTDVADDLLYYLGQNMDKAMDLAKMPLSKMTREMGKLEALVTSQPPALKDEKSAEVKSDPPARKVTTKAPAPIEPVHTDGVTDKDPSKMTPKEYRAWREGKKA